MPTMPRGSLCSTGSLYNCTCHHPRCPVSCSQSGGQPRSCQCQITVNSTKLNNNLQDIYEMYLWRSVSNAMLWRVARSAAGPCVSSWTTRCETVIAHLVYLERTRSAAIHSVAPKLMNKDWHVSGQYSVQSVSRRLASHGSMP